MRQVGPGHDQEQVPQQDRRTQERRIGEVRQDPRRYLRGRRGRQDLPFGRKLGRGLRRRHQGHTGRLAGVLQS